VVTPAIPVEVVRQRRVLTPTLPLLTLHDQEAAYKGYWSLEEPQPGHVVAVHSTFGESTAIGCVIEQRSFSAHRPALQFTDHLLRHGWRVCDLHEAGEHFWYQLTDLS
jgi:hypothetical protein